MTDPSVDLAQRLEAALGGKYRIEQELGRGGMAVVYAATDTTLLRSVAIKVIHPELVANRTTAKRFLEEARVIARLKHPNIVQIHTAGEADGLFYYVMDQIGGATLRSTLGQNGRLPTERALQIAEDVAQALDAAARAGVVHRDVKPENILLHPETGRALLVDFGIAYAVCEDEGKAAEQGWTGPGVALGTPAYMSPEQAAGDRVDTRSDVYALGVVLYEMLSGQPPFHGPRRVVISKQIVDTPVSLGRHRPDLDPDLISTIHQALDKVPEARWPTPLAFRDALRGTNTRPHHRPPRLRQLVLGAAAIAIAASTAISTLDTSSETVSHRTPDTKQSLLILPFTNLQRAEASEWLRDGSVSMLALAMGQWRELSVVTHERLHDLLQRRGVLANTPLGLGQARQLARDAGVTTVVLGEYTSLGDSLQFVARAYDVASGTRLEEATASGPTASDVRPMFDRLAGSLLAISNTTTPRTRLPLAAQTTGSLTAYRLYLQGVEALSAWSLSEAETAFRSAVAIDSTFGLAYFKLALTRGWRFGASDPDGLRAINLAVRFGDRLPARDRQKIEAHQAMAENDLARSKKIYGELVVADSTDPDAWYGLGDAWFHSDEGIDRAPAMTHSLAAFRRAIALDPDYHLAYDHVTTMLAEAAQENARYELTSAEQFRAVDSRSGRVPTHAALVRTRRAALDAARGWVGVQPRLVRAHRALLEAQLAAGNHRAALRTTNQIRELTDLGLQPIVGFLEARIQFAAGEPGRAAQKIQSAIRSFEPDQVRPGTITGDVVGDVLAGTNILAYSGDLDGAEDVISLADILRKNLVGGRPGPGEPDVWKTSQLAQLYSAAGGPVYEMRDLWREVTEAATSEQAPAARASVARAGASAAQGLLLSSGDETVALEQLRALTGSEHAIPFLALMALAQGDSATARAELNRKPGPKAKMPPMSSFAMGDFRPVAAEAHYLLGNYQLTIDLLNGFDAAHLSTRRFDSRWGILARVSLLRGMAYERIGEQTLAGREYSSVLTQWGQADEALQPFVLLAQAGLARLRGARG